MWKGNLKRTLAKIKFSSGTNPVTWCGYLTPSEILFLKDEGVTFSGEHYLRWALQNIALGRSNPFRVCFSISKKSDIYKQLHQQHIREYNNKKL